MMDTRERARAYTQTIEFILEMTTKQRARNVARSANIHLMTIRSQILYLPT